jgi:hypothetical protein
MSGIGKLMKQATRMQQQQMERVQSELANKTVEGVAGGGSVKVVAKCDQTLVSIKINPDAVNPAGRAFPRGPDPHGGERRHGRSQGRRHEGVNAVSPGLQHPGLM